ncbi:TonB-dependent receptor domain-containing protein [Taibaiella soli]|uniref:TonB-dependent receptor n=1 Tax=Taibaiella soli TaxID=1649169 RepID=A0A2W2AWV6_9BACT|nr:TonB-dependent receptor [Taibaiella soli]PZF72188.1 TonB-dependent receptor [Taibaiella soli]
MKILLSTVTMLLLCLQAVAQGNGKITGKIYDAATKQPIEYATATVADSKTGKVVNGGTSDTKGLFVVTDLPNGNYSVYIDFMGYKRDTLAVVLNSQNQVAMLNTIFLQSSQHMLKAVNIVAKTPVVENKIDKIIFNAANDVTSQGGVALDVLKKVPQVNVDVDGNVDILGNTNIRFLINGKPSSVFGNSITDALAAIPASQIKSIEVITSPGAKYDAEGTGGIINIVLKDNKMQGINGNVNLSGGTRLQNGSVNLNIRHGNWGISAYVNGNAQLNSRTLNSQDRTSTDTINNTTSRLLQNGYTDLQRHGYAAGLGMDWSITPKDNITASLSYNYFSNSSPGYTSQEQTTYDASGASLSDAYSSRNFTSKFHSGSTDWSVGYKKTFERKQQELDVLYSASFGANHSNYSQEQTYTGMETPFAGSSSINPGTDYQTNISIDYTQPVGTTLILEGGVKTVLQHINSDASVETLDPSSNEYLSDPTQSYSMKYDRHIYAGYLSSNFTLWKFLDVKAGARFEHTDTKIDFANTSIPSYNTFVPSLMFAHSLSEGQTLKLTYSHRIERPDYRELNPFVNLSDPYNITTGNPQLKPEIGDNFELGYSRGFKKGGNIYVALVYRKNTDDIKPYTTFYTDYPVGDSVYHNVSVTNRQNIGEEIRAGVSISGSLPINKLNLRANIFLSNRRIINQFADGATTNGFDGRFNLNASYQFNKDFVAEAFGNYNSSVHNIQGKTPQFFTYTFALRKQFWNRKASLGITATNPFNKYIRQVTTITDANYVSYSVRELPYRSFGLSFTYKFGKLEMKKAKEEDYQMQDPNQ